MERVGKNGDCLKLTTKDDGDSLRRTARSLAILGIVPATFAERFTHDQVGAVLGGKSTKLALLVAEVYLDITPAPLHEMTRLCLEGALEVFGIEIPGKPRSEEETPAEVVILPVRRETELPEAA